MNKPFLNLTNDDIIERIDIDERLIPYFKRVMKAIQSFFEANDYLSVKDYETYFEKYILTTDENQKMSFRVDNNLGIVGGFYNKAERKIVINFDISEDSVFHTLCHEFIHFLVMHDGESDLTRNTFINEALTESLTRLITLKENASLYDPQVNMLNFANAISGNRNNYKDFLQGYSNLKVFSHSTTFFTKFLGHLSEYQKKFNLHDEYHMSAEYAMIDEDYVEAQRTLIKDFSTDIESIDDYFAFLDNLSLRPVMDAEFVDNIMKHQEQILVQRLIGSNSPMFEGIVRKLEECRKLYDVEDGRFYFEMEGHEFSVDKDGNIKGIVPGYYFVHIGNSISLISQATKRRIDLNLDEIDYSKAKNELFSKKDELYKIFSPSSKKDISTVLNLASQIDRPTKIEKIELPNIEFRKHSSIVYLAYYHDRIEVLNGTGIGLKEDFTIKEFIGKTVSPPKKGAYFGKELDSNKTGYLFSLLDSDIIKKRAIYKFVDEVSKSLSEDELSVIIESYKQTSEYDESYPEYLKDFAIEWYAKKKYEILPLEKRKELEDLVISESKKFVLSNCNGEIVVSLAFDGNVVFVGNKITLVDLEKDGLYNLEYQSVPQTTQSTAQCIIPLDANGNLVTPVATLKKTSAERIEHFQEYSERDGNASMYNDSAIKRMVNPEPLTNNESERRKMRRRIELNLEKEPYQENIGRGRRRF